MVKRIQPKPKPGKQLRAKPANSASDLRSKLREQRQTLFRYNQFIRYYLETKGNATKAAILAGYEAKNAPVQGSQILKLPYVQEKIQLAQARLAERTETSIEKVIIELAKLGMSNMQDYTRINEYGEATIDLSDLDESQWAAIQEVQTEVYMEGHGDDAVPVKRTKIKLYSKTDALDKIARYLGAYNGRRGSDGKLDAGEHDGPAIVNNYTLQIGNASINVSGKESESSGTEGTRAQILTLP